jgi:hypothetical protein
MRMSEDRVSRIMFLIGVAVLLAPSACAADAESLAIAVNGRSEYRIVVPSGKSAAVAYAALELQRLLEEVSGAKLPIVTEDEAGEGPAFLLGPGKRVEKTGLLPEARKLKGDGVLIKTAGRDVVLLGDGDRGQLYSVYVLMERFLGCRFLAHDCTVAPKRDPLTLPAIDYAHSPPFIYREALYYRAADWAFAARQRLNGSNMNQCLGRPTPGKDEVIPGVFIFPFAHSAYGLVPMDPYWKTHSEYYSLVGGKRHAAMIGGQLCWTNPDVLKIAKDQVLKWVEAYPSLASVDVSQNDAYPNAVGACECEKCAAVVKEERAQMGPILRVVNEIADAVARKYPGKYVDTLAYSYTITPPAITKPRDNVIIRLCHFGCYFHGIENEALSAEYRGAVENWPKLAKHVWVWHYGVNFWHYLAPNPNLRSLVKDIGYYNANGVDGMMLQGDLQSPGGELCELRQYLASQLLWDPTQDPMAIRADFCKGYYGRASGDVMEFLAAMDALGAKIDKHIPTNGWNPPDVTPPEFVRDGLAILGRALDKATDSVFRLRIEKLMIPLWYVGLSWPDRYGVTKEQGHAAWIRFKRVIEAEGITTTTEGGPNVKEFTAAMDARFGP